MTQSSCAIDLSGGRINPNIDTDAGSGIERYQYNEIDTVVSACFLLALLWFHQRDDPAVWVSAAPHRVELRFIVLRP